MFDTTSISPDKFWNLTGTAWTAITSVISSLIAAASVVALIIFNWKYLRFAHEQVEAAKAQAAIAKTSLETLQKQILDEQQLERHASMVILHETSTQIEFWRGHLKMETRTDTDRVHLLPDDWNVLVSYVSRHIPGLVGKTRAAALDLRETELLLNRVLQTPVSSRSGNNSSRVYMDGVIQRLGRIMATFDLLEKEFIPSGPPTPPTAE